MGVPLSRVEKEFILGFLIKNKVRVEIKCKNSSTEATFLEQSSKEIKVEVSSMLEEMLEYNVEIKLFFYFQNAYHTFNSTILKRQGNIIIIKNPESLAKNLERKYERVLINGKYKIEFETQSELKPLDYPTCPQFYYPEIPPVNADFTDVKIENILKKFKEKMTSIVSVNKIIMLRNYVSKTFFEDIVLETGKILFVPNSHSELPNRQPFSNFEILLRADWFEFEAKKNKTGLNSLNKTVSDYLTLLKKNDIFSYTIIPVLYRDYIVALIFLMNSNKSSQKIDEKILNYALQFSKIMSFTLKQNGYFKAEDGPKNKHIMPIFDLSPGGAAFYIDNDSFEEKLQLGQNLHFTINIQGREIRVLAKLARKFQNLTKNFYGFVFLDIKTDDFEFLNEFLYKK